jgi:hypothetical protein
MNQAAGAILAFPCKPEARLRAALRALELALDDQALAFQEFRLNTALLGVSLGGLQRSLETYRGTLDNLAGDLAAAHQVAAEAQRLLG